MLLQEGRQYHQKIRASTLSSTTGRKGGHTIKQSATPIKEEDIEEEFDDGASETHSKTTGNVIEEARNYESAQLSNSKSYGHGSIHKSNAKMSSQRSPHISNDDFEDSNTKSLK